MMVKILQIIKQIIHNKENNMKVGQALKSKGGKTYLKFEKTVTLKEGDVLFLSKPSENIDYLVDKGDLTEEEGAAKKAKIPDFVLYNINTKGNTESF